MSQAGRASLLVAGGEWVLEDVAPDPGDRYLPGALILASGALSLGAEAPL